MRVKTIWYDEDTRTDHTTYMHWDSTKRQSFRLAPAHWDENGLETDTDWVLHHYKLEEI